MAKINVALDSFDLWLEDDTNLEHCAKAVAELALSRRSLDFELSCSVLDLTSLFSQFPRKLNVYPDTSRNIFLRKGFLPFEFQLYVRYLASLCLS